MDKFPFITIYSVTWLYCLYSIRLFLKLALYQKTSRYSFLLRKKLMMAVIRVPFILLALFTSLPTFYTLKTMITNRFFF